jgi:hypothetical protein
MEVIMVTGNINHSGLRELLEFESLKHHITVEYIEENNNSIVDKPFRPVIQMIGFSGRKKEKIEIHFADEIITFEIQFRRIEGCKDYIRIGTDNNEIELAGVHKNQLYLFFSFENLFSNASHIERNSINDEIIHGNPANKIFDAICSKAMPLLSINIKEYDWFEEREKYSQLKLKALQDAVQKWESDIRNNQDEIESKTWEIDDLVKKNEQLRTAIESINENTRMMLKRKADDEHQSLVKMLLSGGIRDLDIISTGLSFKTPVVEIEFEDYCYELGPFCVEIPFTGDRIKIKGLDKSRIIDGYAHPHISGDGTPCLGNAGPIIAKLLGTGDMVGAVNTILEFLRSYSKGNAYLRLEKWNPDWEDDEDRFEACYEGSSSYDCVCCGDDSCPFREEAEQRCYENTETYICIACGECSMSETAIEQCRDNHSNWECVACKRDCKYAQDEAECFESHNGEDCPGCTVNTCSHWKDFNEKEEEESCEIEKQQQMFAGGAT